jgi:N-carbamoyl-L-amino-acid hydrolase
MGHNSMTRDAGNLSIDHDRLMESIDRFARIGATAGGGVTRLALTDEDKDARDLLAAELDAIDCQVLIDDLGNMRGVLDGQTALGAVQVASHLDTVIRGGRFDGALGVLGGLEVLRTIRDHGIQPARSIELINWTNEEGARFEPAMIGSGAALGTFDADWMRARSDVSGVRLGDELDRIGYAGSQRNRPPVGRAYLELHIEQGPVLDDAARPVGIVDGILGITWMNITLTGQAVHAGPTPMPDRHDALAAAAETVLAVRDIGTGAGSPCVGTVGRLEVSPNVINTIPGSVRLGADFRSPDDDGLDAMVADLAAHAHDIAARHGVAIEIDRFWTSSPVAFDSGVIEVIASACEAVGVQPVHLWSGAGHDARYAANVQPAGMIFVRSRGGVSHCEAELSDPEDIALGAAVLLHAALLLAEDGVSAANDRG